MCCGDDNGTGEPARCFSFASYFRDFASFTCAARAAYQHQYTAHAKPLNQCTQKHTHTNNTLRRTNSVPVYQIYYAPNTKCIPHTHTHMCDRAISGCYSLCVCLRMRRTFWLGGRGRRRSAEVMCGVTRWLRVAFWMLWPPNWDTKYTHIRTSGIKHICGLMALRRSKRGQPCPVQVCWEIDENHQL